MKKLICLCLSTLLLTSTSAFAVYDTNNGGKTTVNAQTVGIDCELIQRISNGISAFAIDKDGNIINLDCKVDVSKLPAMLSNAYSNNSAYEMTIEAQANNLKVKSNTADENSSTVTCTAYITMQWEDNVGPDNVLKNLSGGVTYVKGSHTSSAVEWGGTHNRIAGIRNFGASKTFSVNPNYTNAQLHGHYALNFDGDSQFDLYVCVQPSIFD